MPKSRWTQRSFSAAIEGNNLVIRGVSGTRLRIRKVFCSPNSDVTGLVSLKSGNYISASADANGDTIASVYSPKAGSQYLLLNTGGEFIETEMGADLILETPSGYAQIIALNVEFMHATQDEL